MDAAIVAVILFAALLHVTWNVLLKTAGDPMTAATVGIVAATLVAVPLAAAGWLVAGQPAIPTAAVVLAVVSGVLETAYFVCLSGAYRHGDLSVVYPTARGTAPLLAVLIGIGLFGERLQPTGVVGVVLLLVGLLALTEPWRILLGGLRPSDRVSTRYALATGVLIALYSAVDRAGARLTEPWLYAALIWPAMAAGLLTWRRLAIAARVRTLVPALDTGTHVAMSQPLGVSAVDRRASGIDAPRAIVGGLLTLVAYALILFAYTLAPLTAVAPLRESAVVVASGWGTLRLGEADGRRDAARRLMAAAVVAAGIVLLVLEG